MTIKTDRMSIARQKAQLRKLQKAYDLLISAYDVLSQDCGYEETDLVDLSSATGLSHIAFCDVRAEIETAQDLQRNTFNINLGYVAAMRHGFGWIVVYDNKRNQTMRKTEHRWYAERFDTDKLSDGIVSTRTRSIALSIMRNPQDVEFKHTGESK